MVWSLERRELARERMRLMNARRWGAPVEEIVSEEKLKQMEENQNIQAVGRGSVPWTVEGRIARRDYLLRVGGDGKIVSMNGPCLCGVNRNQWHERCFEVKASMEKVA